MIRKVYEPSNLSVVPTRREERWRKGGERYIKYIHMQNCRFITAHFQRLFSASKNGIVEPRYELRDESSTSAFEENLHSAIEENRPR